MTTMSIKSLKSVAIAIAAALLATGSVAVHADGRSPEYADARASGKVGEQQDGYLGVVGSQPAAIVAMVRDLNNKRRAVYTEGAAASAPSTQSIEICLRHHRCRVHLPNIDRTSNPSRPRPSMTIGKSESQTRKSV